MVRRTPQKYITTHYCHNHVKGMEINTFQKDERVGKYPWCSLLNLSIKCEKKKCLILPRLMPTLTYYRLTFCFPF